MGDEISEPVDVTEGVLQGEVLSPILFALFIADLSDFFEANGIRVISMGTNREITLLAYADDLVFFLDSQAGMKKILKTLYKYCTLNYLTLSSKKSKIIIFCKGGKSNDPGNFKYGSEIIEVVKEYTYLGTIFTNRGLFEKNAKNFVTRASLATTSTISLIKTVKYKVSWNKINLLFDSLVKSIISYASPIWSPRFLDLVEKVQCNFFKRFLSLPQCTPNYAVRLEVNRPHMATFIFKLIIGWLKKSYLCPLRDTPTFVF